MLENILPLPKVPLTTSAAPKEAGGEVGLKKLPAEFDLTKIEF